MKVLAILIMLAALYLLYRIAFQKPEKNGDFIPKTPETGKTGNEDTVKKTLFVRADSRHAQPTSATPLTTEKQEEKAYNFAPENDGSEDDSEDSDLDIEPDESETNFEDEDDEFPTSERDAELADGFSIEEMERAAAAVENPTNENAGILFRVERTDMFEKLVSSDEGKAERIRALITRHVQSLQADVADDDYDYGSFNIADYV